MFTMVAGEARELQPGLESALAAYRYRVFVKELGWPLPVQDGLERDDFDRPDTLYVIARHASGDLYGCARLLPTHKPYLLSEVFPELMGDMPLPHSPVIWELSRFSTSPPDHLRFSALQSWQTTCALMAQVVRAALAQGAERLIAFSALGNERLLRRMGVHVHRVAAPQLIDGKPVLAFWIELDQQTQSALGLVEVSGVTT